MEDQSYFNVLKGPNKSLFSLLMYSKGTYLQVIPMGYEKFEVSIDTYLEWVTGWLISGLCGV